MATSRKSTGFSDKISFGVEVKRIGSLDPLDQVARRLKAIGAAVDGLAAKLSGRDVLGQFSLNAKQMMAKVDAELKKPGVNLKRSALTQSDFARIFGFGEAELKAFAAAQRKVFDNAFTRAGTQKKGAFSPGTSGNALDLLQAFQATKYKEAQAALAAFHNILGGAGQQFTAAAHGETQLAAASGQSTLSLDAQRAAIAAKLPLVQQLTAQTNNLGRAEQTAGAQAAAHAQEQTAAARQVSAAAAEVQASFRRAPETAQLLRNRISTDAKGRERRAITFRSGSDLVTQQLDAEGGVKRQTVDQNFGKLDEASKKRVSTILHSLQAQREAYAAHQEKVRADQQKHFNQLKADYEKRLRNEETLRNQSLRSQEGHARVVDRATEKSIRRNEEAEGRRKAAAQKASANQQGFAAAEARLAELRSAGWDVASSPGKSSFKNGRLTEERTATATRAHNGMVQTIPFKFVTENGQPLLAEIGKLREKLIRASGPAGGGSAAGDKAGRDFGTNLLHVASWTASVGVLYGAIGLARQSLAAFINTAGQMARLDQVFSKIGGTTRQLSDDLMQSAAINGRSTQEAMQAGVQWSRMGLARAQVNEMVRVSLVAANVAEMDAAAATEKLAGIYVAYRLSVGQMGTVLSQLNTISNNYNVTNADMLEGISRTAAVAQQAGMSLQELMGLIGATVGGTGQTGANIGNALKSLTVALSNPALQQSLRQEFRFEVTTGGSDIQNMSDILAGLFVRYQELTNAERQHLLVRAAGKTQASRVAAVMDNYVRAMGLAVKAQRDMDSAEKENAKIKDTLKSQLAGLTSEWNRFVAAQMTNLGPVSGNRLLMDLTAGFKNLLTAANAPGISTAMTVLIGLTTVLGMRMMMVTKGAEGGGKAMQFLRNSMNGISKAWGDAKGLMAEVAQGGAGKGLFQYGAGQVAAGRAGGGSLGLRNLARQGLDAAGTVIGKGIGAVLAAPYQIANVISNPARMIELAKKGLAQLQVGFGRIIQLAGVMGSAISSAFQGLLVGAAAWGILKVINYGMEQIGLSSERATRELAGFNAQAEKASNLAQAAGNEARLYQTLARSFASMGEGARQKTLSDLRFLDPNASKELQDTYASRGVAGVETEFKRRSASSLDQSEYQRGKELESIAAANARREKEISRLQGTMGNTFGMGDASRQKAIDELEAQKGADLGRTVKLLEEAGEAERDWLEQNVRHLAIMGRLKDQADGVRMAFSALPTGGSQVGQEGMRQGGNTALLERYQTRLNRVLEETRASYAADEAAKEQRAALNKRKDELKLYKAQLTDFKKTGVISNALAENSSTIAPAGGEVPTDVLGPDYGRKVQSAIDATTAAIAEQEALLKQVQNRVGEIASRAKEERTIREKIRDLTAEQANAVGRLEAARRADRWKNLGTLQGMESTAADYGHEGDRLLNVRDQLERARAERVADIARGENAVFDIESQQVQLLTILEQKKENVLNIERAKFDLLKQERQLEIDRQRELQRSLLNAGPRDLLRLAGANAMTNGGQNALGAGQFLALSPEMRGTVNQFNPAFDPRFGEIKNAQNLLGGFDTNGVMETLRKLDEEIAQTAVALGSKFKDNLSAAAIASWEFTASLTDATRALAQLPGIIQSIQLAALVPGLARPANAGGNGGAPS